MRGRNRIEKDSFIHIEDGETLRPVMLLRDLSPNDSFVRFLSNAFDFARQGKSRGNQPGESRKSCERHQEQGLGCDQIEPTQFAAHKESTTGYPGTDRV